MSLGWETLHWLRPHWLWALLALPLGGWLLARRRHADGVWRHAVDAHLLPHLLLPAHTGRRRWVLWGYGLAWLLAVLALAGPAWQQVPMPLYQPQAPLLIALDLFSRMNAADLAPDRATRARLKIERLLALRQGGQIGLLAYAGEAFTVAPLTEDLATVGALLGALHPSLMPVDGQRGDRAIALAADLLRQAGFARGRILVLTDVADARSRQAAAAASRQGYAVSVLGLGTPQGAPVPGQDGGFLADGQGRLRMARLEEASLRGLAQAGGGRYTRHTASDADLRALDLLDPQTAAERVVDGPRAWRDDGPWLLLPALALLLPGLRRGLLALPVLMPPMLVPLVLALWLPAPPAAAFEWAGLWRRDDQRAAAALGAGDFEAARRLARDPALAGAAAYRQGDWPAAIAAFAQGKDAVSHYNRGNALARAGRYTEALEAYDQALALSADFADARANRQAVEDWLRRQPPENGGEGQQAGGAERGEGGQSERGDQAGQPDPGAKAGAPEAGDGKAPGAESSRPPQTAGSDPSQESRGEAPDGPGSAAGNAAQQHGATPEAAAAAEAALREAMRKALAGRQDADGTGKPDAEPAPGAAATEDPAARERRQEIEQLLRRVPDDPGGLLRRKFALEYQRRQAEREEP